jgi:hypothetical protein
VGDLAYPLVSDLSKKISEAYGVLTDEGIALRGLFIIDPEGIVQHATINNLAFGRNVEETIRILAVRACGSCLLLPMQQLCLCWMFFWWKDISHCRQQHLHLWLWAAAAPAVCTGSACVITHCPPTL